MSLENYAQEYFAKLNSIATRMHQDMEETKTNYDSLWYKITDDERKQILTDSIIKPEILIEYQLHGDDNNKNDDSEVKYAAKLVIDDNCLYRDEHSGPFCYKTQSQRDLRICECNNESENNRMNNSIISTKNTEVIIKDKVDKKVEEIKFEADNTSTILPKTGLDFLDNW